MNKKYEKNLSKQKLIKEKIKELQDDLQELKEEQEEMENVEILKSYRSTEISLDDFLQMIKNHKREEIKNTLNLNEDMEEKINEEHEK